MQNIPTAAFPKRLQTELIDSPELQALMARVQLLMVNQLGEALEEMRVASLRADLLSRAQLQAYLHLWMADCHFYLHQLHAVRAYEKALEAAEQCRDDEVKTCALHGLARVFSRFGDSDSGLEYGELALQHAQAHGQTEQVPGILLTIALLFAYSGQYQRSIELNAEALALSRSSGNLSQQFRALNNTADGLVCWHDVQVEKHEQADPDLIAQAIAHGMAALQLAQTLHSVVNELCVRETLAHALEAQGDIQGALTCLEAAIPRLTGYGYVAEELDIKVRAGALLLRLARVDEAIAQLNIARGEALELANYPYFADLLRMLSTAYEVRGDYQAALNSYKDFHLITLKNRDQRTEISAKLFAAKRDIARAQSEAEAQKHIVHQLEDSNRNLRVQANQDPLTGLPNRRHLEQEMANRFAAHDGQSTFVMCDVDRFKQVNDQFSHTIGDEVLRCIAVLIRANLRTEDMAARIGGEEFALLLDHAKDALEVCERIRKSMESYSWHLIAPGLAVTMSFGYTALRAGDDLNSLMSRADGALYQAKHGGRNCVVKA